MESSRLIPKDWGQPASVGSFYELVSGESLGDHGAPARTAWEIEMLASQRGWPADELLGSEATLREELKVSRETLREAIRIVESRGAVRVRRGRSGGIVMAPANPEQTAIALATYFKASGISDHATGQSLRGFDQLLAWQIARTDGPLAKRETGEPIRHWLARVSGRQTYTVCVRTLDRLHFGGQPDRAVPEELADALATKDAARIFRILSALPFDCRTTTYEATVAGSLARGSFIAASMVTCRGAGDSPLGNEADLCEEFDTSRALVRQALRILQDLDMLQVRKGRGGGYALKRPSPIGIIRQFFVWLAARNWDPFKLNALMWDLNAANVRLAGEQLAHLPAAEQEAFFQRLECTFNQHPNVSIRFVVLQQMLAGMADCPLVETIARCVVSYQARGYGDFPIGPPDQADERALRGIVDALRSGQLDLAEQRLRQFQDAAERKAIETFGLSIAAE